MTLTRIFLVLWFCLENINPVLRCVLTNEPMSTTTDNAMRHARSATEEVPRATSRALALKYWEVAGDDKLNELRYLQTRNFVSHNIFTC